METSKEIVGTFITQYRDMIIYWIIWLLIVAPIVFHSGDRIHMELIGAIPIGISGALFTILMTNIITTEF